MKLTKKILSIVLAACLLLGTVAVAANAAGLTEYDGSKLTYRIEADKTEVKPGETVTFSVYMTTNYYTGSAGGEFFVWTSAVLELVQYEKKNFATKFTTTPNEEPQAGLYPATHSTDVYKGLLFSRAINAGVTSTKVVDDELIYEIKLKVKDDAAPNTKAVFEMPTGSVKSPSLNNRKGVIYQVLSTSSTEMVDYAYSYCNIVDLSEASVTVTVASAVEYCDYTVLETAVAKAPEKTAEYYNTTDYNAWVAAKAAGQALLDAAALEKSDENQKTIDDAAALIENKLAALEPSYLSLDKLNAAVEACDEIDPADKDYYAEADYNAWQAALAAAKDAQGEYTTDDPATKQAEVDAIADALTNAYGKLKAAYVDASAIAEAISAYGATEYTAEYYDEAAYDAYADALAAAKAADFTNKPDTQANRDAVAKIAADLKDAYEALEANFVDASAIAEAINAYGTTEYTAEYYDEAAYDAYADALAAAKAADFAGVADTQANRDAVAKIAADLKNAYGALKANFVDASAIAEAIRAYGATEYAAEYYDEAAYDAYADALAAAKAADFATAADTQANRDAVAKIAADLKNAYGALEANFVDVSELEAAIAESVLAYADEYYDAAALAEFKAAIASGNELVAEFKDKAPATAENEEAVAAAATEITDLFNELAPAFVSYASLEDAIANYSSTANPDFYYTKDSWNAYADALAVALEANDNRPDPLPAASDAEAQEAIDALAAALEEAYNNLAPVGGCTILSVKTLQEVYDVRDVVNFEVVLENTGYSKIQFIRSNGDTLTYNRTNTSVKSITVNEDGNEVWVIARRIYEEKCTEYARAKVGQVWETGLFAYDLECNGEDYAVKSVDVTVNGTAVTSATKKDVVTITIVTGPAARRVRLVNPVTGGTMTYSTPTQVNNDGTKVWVINKTFSSVKTYDFDVYSAGSTNVLEDSGFDISIQITNAPVSQLPSTGEVADAVNEVLTGISAKRMLKGSTQTFTIVTDKDAKAVRITSNTGAVTKISTPASTDGNEKTWVCEKVINNPGEYSYTVEALYGSTWYAADETLDFVVLY